MLKEEKQSLRAIMKDQRALLSIEQRKTYSSSITEKIMALDEIASAETVFCYISYGTEVETHDLIQQLLQAGKTLAAPKIINKTRMIAVQFNDWSELKPAEMGILTPISSDPLLARFDVSLTPGLAFTSSGKRIGYGAGYYDRWFSKNDIASKVGVAFETQIIEDIPTDEFDQRVDAIITETQHIQVSNQA